MKDLLQMKFFPTNNDKALLVLRLVAVLPMLIKHGRDKLFFLGQIGIFPDPIGIGHFTMWALTSFVDCIVTLLMVVGLATRWAALVSFLYLFVTWAFIYHFDFFWFSGDHGEVLVIYMGAALTLLYAGAGKYSVDAYMNKK